MMPRLHDLSLAVRVVVTLVVRGSLGRVLERECVWLHGTRNPHGSEAHVPIGTTTDAWCRLTT